MSPTARRLCLVFVLVSVICAQALGFMHGIVHAFHVDEQQTEANARAVAVPEAFSPSEADGGIEALFADHDGARDCRMFDGVGHQAPLLYLPALTFPLMPSMCMLRWLDGAFIARRAALFEARAPPLSH